MKLRSSRRGMGVIEILIVVGVLVVISGLVFVALTGKKANPSSQSSTATKSQASSEPNREVNSVEDVKTEVTALDTDDTADLSKDVDGLSSDLNGL